MTELEALRKVTEGIKTWGEEKFDDIAYRLGGAGYDSVPSSGVRHIPISYDEVQKVYNGTGIYIIHGAHPFSISITDKTNTTSNIDTAFVIVAVTPREAIDEGVDVTIMNHVAKFTWIRKTLNIGQSITVNGIKNYPGYFTHINYYKFPQYVSVPNI